jgi:hypothetical protein
MEKSKLEMLKEEVKIIYSSTSVEHEIGIKSKLGLAFIKIDDYIKELENTIELLKNQIK